MDRNGVDWEGPFTAMITPFHPNDEIDESGLRDHVEFLVAHGVRGLVPNGCTGEFWAQTIPERKRVAEIVRTQAEIGERRTQVQARPPHDDRALPPSQETVDLGMGELGVLPGAEGGVDRQERDQPVLELRPLGRARDAGQRLEAFVDLERIG